MQRSTECFRLFFGDGVFYCVESDCNTWNNVGIMEVIILANVILGQSRDLRLHMLKALQNSPNRHFKK